MLLTDHLDSLSPYVYLVPRLGDCPTFPSCRHARGYCYHPLSWRLSGVQVQIRADNRSWATADEAMAELAGEGYQISDTIRQPDNSTQYMLCHSETAAALDAATQADAAKWACAESCYLRYGDLPDTGKSHNYRDGTVEAGVSVFRGQILPDGTARATVSHNYEMGTLLSLQAEGRPLYLVTGVYIGDGSDGEPVLADCTIIRQVREK